MARITDKDLGWSKLMRQIKTEAAKGEQLTDVGWTDPELAERARHNEFGTATMDPQPFIRPAFDALRARLEEEQRRAAERVIDGKAADPQAAAELLADEIQSRAPVDTGALRDGVTVGEGQS